jgi:hypothetical protein
LGRPAGSEKLPALKLAGAAAAAGQPDAFGAAGCGGGAGLSYRGRRTSGLGNATSAPRLDVAALAAGSACSSQAPSPRHSKSGGGQLSGAAVLAPAVARLGMRHDAKGRAASVALLALWLLAVHGYALWYFAVGC